MKNKIGLYSILILTALILSSCQNINPWQEHRNDPNAHPLIGDVSGYVGSNLVERIRGVPISQDTPAEGQVLTLINGNWQPADLPTSAPVVASYVERPVGSPRYMLIAAGILTLDGTIPPATFNGLRAHPIGESQILLTFDGYRQPEGFTYIVNALPVSHPDIPSPVIAFNGFQPEGIVLLITDSGEVISDDLLTALSLMVEVNLFDAQ